MMMDYCGSGWNPNSRSSNHCFAYDRWRGTGGGIQSLWGISNYPLQIGGLSHPVPKRTEHSWRYQPYGDSLQGCLSHLRVNGEVFIHFIISFSNDIINKCRRNQNLDKIIIIKVVIS